jgi:hypothetical protein
MNTKYLTQRRKGAEIFKKEIYRDNRINKDKKKLFLSLSIPVIPVNFFSASLRLCVSIFFLTIAASAQSPTVEKINFG